MANFTSAINALVAERDRVFLLRVAEDYKLPFEELQQKYLETAEEAIKVPRKYKKREAKSVAVAVVTEGASEVPKAPKAPKAKAEKQCCTAQTSKKEACKFSALKGEIFCKRHLKQSLGESTEKDSTPKAAKKATKKADQPVHTHTLTADDADCELCQSHGNPLEVVEAAFEVVPHTGPVKQLTAAERLAALLAESEDEGESSEDDMEAGVGEEEFEEDD
jgi:hypothetical protein